MSKPERCELCGSSDDYLNFHHLIPRTLHSNKWFKKNFTKEQMNSGIWICKKFCHPEIHKYIDEKEMGTTYNTLEKLLEHPSVQKYINWRSKRVN